MLEPNYFATQLKTGPTVRVATPCCQGWGISDVFFPSTQELDRLAAETVRRLFGKINGALYRGKTTGTLHVDRECHEWSSHFPHLG